MSESGSSISPSHDVIDESDSGSSIGYSFDTRDCANRVDANDHLTGGKADTTQARSTHARSSHARVPALRPLAEQLVSIARQLEAESFVKDARPDLRLASGSEHGSCADGGDASANNGQAPRPLESNDRSDMATRRDYAAKAITQYERRRRRTEIFGQADLFGEPAWDILLDLYIAHAQQNPVSVSSACIGAAVPSSTALRWLGILCDNGLCRREHDPQDQRRVLVHLTERALKTMDAYFESLPSQEP